MKCILKICIRTCVGFTYQQVAETDVRFSYHHLKLKRKNHKINIYIIKNPNNNA